MSPSTKHPTWYHASCLEGSSSWPWMQTEHSPLFRLSQYTGEPGTKAHIQCSYCSTPYHTKSLCFRAFLRPLNNTAGRKGHDLGNYNPVYILLVKSIIIKDTRLGDFDTEGVLSRCSFAICSIYSAKSNLRAVIYHFSTQQKSEMQKFKADLVRDISK